MPTQYLARSSTQRDFYATYPIKLRGGRVVDAHLRKNKQATGYSKTATLQRVKRCRGQMGDDKITLAIDGSFDALYKTSQRYISRAGTRGAHLSLIGRKRLRELREQRGVVATATDPLSLTQLEDVLRVGQVYRVEVAAAHQKFTHQHTAAGELRSVTSGRLMPNAYSARTLALDLGGAGRFTFSERDRLARQGDTLLLRIDTADGGLRLDVTLVAQP